MWAVIGFRKWVSEFDVRDGNGELFGDCGLSQDC